MEWSKFGQWCDVIILSLVDPNLSFVDPNDRAKNKFYDVFHFLKLSECQYPFLFEINIHHPKYWVLGINDVNIVSKIGFDLSMMKSTWERFKK